MPSAALIDARDTFREVIDSCDSDLAKGLTTTSISRFLPRPPSITTRLSYTDSRIPLFALDRLQSSSTFFVDWDLTGV